MAQPSYWSQLGRFLPWWLRVLLVAIGILGIGSAEYLKAVKWFAGQRNWWPSLIYLIVLIITVYAFYRAGKAAWEEEHNRRVATQQELERVRNDNAPNLIGSIDQVVVAPDSKVGARIFLILSIRNIGAPSIAERYTLIVESSGQTFSGENTQIPDKVRLEGSGGLGVTVHKGDAMYEKTLKPIPRGGMERGWLHFVFRGIPMGLLEGKKMTVGFVDVSGREYSVSHEGKSEPGEPMYYPGTEPPTDSMSFL
jgi:hypothetical protein